MSIKDQFSTIAYMRRAKTWQEFSHEINKNEQNSYLRFFQTACNGPLKYARLFPNREYIFLTNEDDKIIAVASYEEIDNVILLDAIGTHEDHQNNGYGQGLLWMVMKHAHDQGKTFDPGQFIRDGWQHLASIQPQLHRALPGLVIQYKTHPKLPDNRTVKITGEKTYHLKKTPSNGIEAVLEMA